MIARRSWSVGTDQSSFSRRTRPPASPSITTASTGTTSKRKVQIPAAADARLPARTVGQAQGELGAKHGGREYQRSTADRHGADRGHRDDQPQRHRAEILLFKEKLCVSVANLSRYLPPLGVSKKQNPAGTRSLDRCGMTVRSEFPRGAGQLGRSFQRARRAR